MILSQTTEILADSTHQRNSHQRIFSISQPFCGENEFDDTDEGKLTKSNTVYSKQKISFIEFPPRETDQRAQSLKDEIEQCVDWTQTALFSIKIMRNLLMDLLDLG